jgi:hypothetical protein
VRRPTGSAPYRPIAPDLTAPVASRRVKPFEISGPVAVGLLEIEAGAERRIRARQYRSAHELGTISLH